MVLELLEDILVDMLVIRIVIVSIGGSIWVVNKKVKLLFFSCGFMVYIVILMIVGRKEKFRYSRLVMVKDWCIEEMVFVE